MSFEALMRRTTFAEFPSAFTPDEQVGRECCDLQELAEGLSD